MIWITSETRKRVAEISCITAELHYTSAQSSAEVKQGLVNQETPLAMRGWSAGCCQTLLTHWLKRVAKLVLCPSPHLRPWFSCGTKTRTGFQVVLFHVCQGQWLAVGQGSTLPCLLREVPLNHIQHNPSPLPQTLPGGTVRSGLSHLQERLLLLRHPEAVLPAVGRVRLWDPIWRTACAPMHLHHLTAHQGWAVALSPAAGHRTGQPMPAVLWANVRAGGRSSEHSSESTWEAPCSHTRAPLRKHHRLKAPQPKVSPGSYEGQYLLSGHASTNFCDIWALPSICCAMCLGQEPTQLHLQDMWIQLLAAGVGHIFCCVSLGMKCLEAFVRPLSPPAAVWCSEFLF